MGYDSCSFRDSKAATVIEIPSPAIPAEPSPRRMGLPVRLALLTAAMAVGLVLAATEIALSWSHRSRLDDLRMESEALAGTLATYLLRIAPTGDPDAL